ncbi:MAG: GNAT family N-acetyltransferase [Sandaracinaceae bacterium]|nr:GNAT family N-acetyltransferase [Myxococcales bacterium]MCB9662213.1 GNAT family N-acetyltransferase [Sandaracinaceae bacterium]
MNPERPEPLRDVTIRHAPREPVGPLVETLLAIDDDASALYASGGFAIELAYEHPFVQAELARWAACTREGRVLLAEVDGQAVGFAAYARVDGLAYLDQLAVRCAFMRRGIGRALVDAVVTAVQADGASALWLTTYAHLPWNGPYYGTLGFVRVEETACGPELRALLEEQRAALPAPDQRVAMVRAISG